MTRSSSTAEAEHSYLTQLNHAVQDNLFLNPTYEEEIISILNSLDNTSTAGEDTIKALPVKALASEIASPLTHIFNMLTSGIFPNRLKIARVTLIHKSGKYDELSNYRPISLLSLFSKVAGRILHTRFNKFLLSKNMIANQSFGLQEGKSTEKTFIDIYDKIIKNIEKKYFTIGIYLDFQKVFDIIKQNILLSNLEVYDIRGV